MKNILHAKSVTLHTSEHQPSQLRRGSVLVLAALLLVFVFAMVAFAVDVGYIVHVDTEFQRTADACALAAARVMPDLDAARAVAEQVALENANLEGPALAAADVVFGHWDRPTSTWTAGDSDINAVRVIVRRTADRGNPLGLFFARVLGQSATDIQADAIAMYDNQLCGPLVGIDRARIPGDPVTDSYRSGDGFYWQQNPGSNGSVCSDGPIDVSGSPIINGNANPGQGAETTISGDATVTGNTIARLRPLNMPLVDDGRIALLNDNGILPPIQMGRRNITVPTANGDFNLNGGVVYDMPPGRYYFHDMRLSGQSVLNISGRTVIYLSGSLDTSGGEMVNGTRAPQNLQIFMTGGAATVNANVDFFGTLYAPNTPVRLSGAAQWHGAVVGQTLTISGTGDFHYDEDLDFRSEVQLPNRTGLVK